MLIMKYLAAFLFLLFLSVRPCRATHDLQYFIYIQDEYIQGPWRHAENVVEYLRPVTFTELFGSEPLDIPLHVFRHLAENRPEDYRWERTLSIAGDTLVVDTPDRIQNFERVRNEVTLSMVSQSMFRHVRFLSAGNDVTLSRDDVELPYFALVHPGQDRSGDEFPESVGTSDAERTLPDKPAETLDAGDLNDLFDIREQDLLRQQQNEPGLSLWIGFGGMLIAGIMGFGLGKVIGKR